MSLTRLKSSETQLKSQVSHSAVTHGTADMSCSPLHRGVLRTPCFWSLETVPEMKDKAFNLVSNMTYSHLGKSSNFLLSCSV